MTKLVTPEWIKIARRDVGTREVAGPGNNARVMTYYKDVGHDWVQDDGVAWCAAFAGACLERAGLKSTRSLRARSYLDWGVKLRKPRPGCIAVLKRGRNPAFGHVGFFVRETYDQVVLLGGNQSDAVNQRRFSKDRVLGWRWPGVSDISAMVAEDSVFEKALQHVLEFEGMFSNHPDDPGGPTYRGVTIGLLASQLGTQVVAANRSRLVADVKSLTTPQVRTIYRRNFWDAVSGDSLSDGLAVSLFDAAVQHGPMRAIRMLQGLIGVDADGEIGPITLAAVARELEVDLVRRHGEVRRAFYKSLKHFPSFGRGWMRRLDATIMLATSMSGRTSAKPKRVQPPSQQQKETTMNKETKWWMESLTIWGTFVTALSTVLPIVGPFVGLDLSAAMIEQFGEAVARLIQALGGVTGTFMAVYGRLRATSGLGQRVVNVKV